jgi:2-dehydropantoate 2-reductase
MLRDMERHVPIEADHIVGDLIARAGARESSRDPSLLRVAYANLKAYEARQARTQAGQRAA